MILPKLTSCLWADTDIAQSHASLIPLDHVLPLGGQLLGWLTVTYDHWLDVSFVCMRWAGNLPQSFSDLSKSVNNTAIPSGQGREPTSIPSGPHLEGTSPLSSCIPDTKHALYALRARTSFGAMNGS